MNSEMAYFTKSNEQRQVHVKLQIEQVRPCERVSTMKTGKARISYKSTFHLIDSFTSQQYHKYRKQLYHVKTSIFLALLVFYTNA